MLDILIVVATSHELKAVKTQIETLSFPRGFSISYLSLGIGNIAATYTLASYLTEHPDIDFVCNIGICGYTDQRFSVIQIARTVLAANRKECVVPVFFQFGPLVSIESFDAPVLNPDQTKEPYVDMESYAIAYVCEKKKIPHLILKVPYDRVGQETLDFEKGAALELLSESIDYAKLIADISRYLEKVPPKHDWMYVKIHFRLTFTEFENCKKLIARYEALTKKDFSSFFDENKHLTKKKFIGMLSSEDIEI